MSNPLAGTSFQEFLKRQMEVAPPTAEQEVWATQNFSSRVDPPVVTTPPGPGGG